MDSSFYTSQFDTARELLSTNNPESTTGLYSILCALHELHQQNDTEWDKNQIHMDYKNVVMAVYLIYHTDRKTDIYYNKTYKRPESFLIIQNFKKDCFKEITKILEIIQPNQGIQWRIIK
jgi:hypothetical protein